MKVLQVFVCVVAAQPRLIVREGSASYNRERLPR